MSNDNPTSTQSPRLPRLASAAARAYVERLVDLVPAAEAHRVRLDVEAMILDRVEDEAAATEGTDPAVAEIRALNALGTPEQLAARLGDLSTRTLPAAQRSFVRLFLTLFPCHLLLSIVLSVAGSEAPGIPSLLGPLPTDSALATLMGVLAILLIDVGVLAIVTTALASGGRLPLLRLGPAFRSTPRELWLGFVLLVVLGVVVNAFVPEIFALHGGPGGSATFLAAPLLAWVPWLTIPLLLFCVRQVFLLVRGLSSASAIAMDALGWCALVGWLVVAATLPERIRFPTTELGARVAAELNRLVDALVLCLALAAALFSLIRAVRQVQRLGRALGAASQHA